VKERKIMKTKQTIMKSTTIRTLWSTLLAVMLGTLLAGQACGQIFVVTNGDGMVGKYNLDGTTVNASLISGLNSPWGLALSGNNLYVSGGGFNGFVGEYDASTGAAINTSLVLGLSQYPEPLLLSGNNLYVVSSNAGFIGLYDATTGAAINPSLVTGLSYPEGIAISGNTLYLPSQIQDVFGQINKYDATTGAPISVPFIQGFPSTALQVPEGLLISGNILYVADSIGNTIGEYDATTGAVINASFISTGLSYPSQLALLGNHLFVSNVHSGTIGEYDATTGATINASLISGLNSPVGLVVVAPLYSAQVQQPINADGSGVFTVRRGVVPVKFTLSQGGVATCDLPPATIALTRTAGGTIGAIDESVYTGSADTGSNFRIDTCQYIYNLSASALGVGTYRVDITIDNRVVGSGVFQLR
jgi:WD40 repeat protein